MILEAAASGLPAAAAAAGGALELVHDGRTGLLAPADDPIALAAAIRELSAFPDRRRRFGQAARAAALDRTWERSFDRTDGRLPTRHRSRPHWLQGGA